MRDGPQQRAHADGAAAPVVLASTHASVLEVVSLEVLREHAVDVPDDVARSRSPWVARVTLLGRGASGRCGGRDPFATVGGNAPVTASTYCGGTSGKARWWSREHGERSVRSRRNLSGPDSGEEQPVLRHRWSV